MKPARGALRNNIPGYAGGGLIDGFKRAVGMAPAETMREKFARQDAERAAKQAPAVPKPVAVPEGQTAISSYASGTLTGDRKKQMEEAIGKKVGGAIRGKGTGTSDEIPIMASNGEFMIKASSVKKIGIEALEALNAVGDQPDEKDGPAEAKAEYGMKCGGAVRKKMATGGLVDPLNPTAAPVVAPTTPVAAPVAAAPATQNPLYTPGSAQDPKATVNIVAGNKSPFGGPTPGEQAIATPPKPQGALRTPSLMATAPAAVAPTPAIPPIQQPVIKMFAGGSVNEAKRKALLAQIPTGGTGVGPTPQPVATPAVAPATVPVMDRLLSPQSQWNPVSQDQVKAAETSRIDALAAKEIDRFKAREFAANNPGQTMPVVAPTIPVAAPATVPSAAYPEESQRAPAVNAPAPGGDIPTAPVAATAPTGIDPLAAKAERDAQTQKDIALGNQMEATRKASEAEGYAAQDRGIDTSIAIAAKVDAERARQHAQNTLSSTTDNAATRAQKGEASRTLAALDQQASQTAGNEAAARRTNQADQTQRRGQDIQAGALRQSNQFNQFNQQLARDKFGIEQSQESRAAAKDALDAKQRDRLQSAFDAYDKDPSEKSAERVRVLMGKEKAPAPDSWGIRKVTDATGAVTEIPYNKATGEDRGSNQAGQAPLPPGMVKQVGTANGKPVYLDKNGKQVIAKG